jgi:hypothetical protein
VDAAAGSTDRCWFREVESLIQWVEDTAATRGANWFVRRRDVGHVLYFIGLWVSDPQCVNNCSKTNLKSA